MYPSTSTQQPAAICALKSPADAIHILEAVRLGLVPRVTRRLTGHERSMIRPGTVWVWEEEETNMRRWTDGRRWGASRVGGGGFLVYTESSDNLSPPPSRGTGTDYMGRPHSGHGYAPYGRSALKPESLIKQTYSTTMTHPVTGKAKKFHVVAYSSKHNPQGDANNPLPLPQQLPLLATLKITPGIWPEWEHRRDPDYSSRRATSYPPPPSGSQATPVTATASPDVNEQYDQYQRGRSPGREPYTARASPSQIPPQRFQQPYTPPMMDANSRDPYTGRSLSHQPPPYPPQPDRYHPYHDSSRGRPYAPGSSAPSPMPPAAGGQPPMPQEGYYDDRRYAPQQIQQPQPHPAHRPSPPNVYAHPYDPYARGYPRRDQYVDEMPPHSQYYHQNPPTNRSPDDKARERTAPTHLAPPTVETTAPPTSGRKSPKMSIDSSLLNPSSAAAAAPGGQTQPQSQAMSASSSSGPNGGFTLPPLRLAIDDRSGGSNGISAVNSPSGYGKLSPRGASDSGQSAGEGSVQGEDARQLGELGKRVSL